MFLCNISLSISLCIFFQSVVGVIIRYWTKNIVYVMIFQLGNLSHGRHMGSSWRIWMRSMLLREETGERHKIMDGEQIFVDQFDKTVDIYRIVKIRKTLGNQKTNRIGIWGRIKLKPATDPWNNSVNSALNTSREQYTHRKIGKISAFCTDEYEWSYFVMIVPLSVLKTVTSVILCSQRNWEWYVLNRLHGVNFISYKVYTVL